MFAELREFRGRMVLQVEATAARAAADRAQAEAAAEEAAQKAAWDRGTFLLERQTFEAAQAAKQDARKEVMKQATSAKVVPGEETTLEDIV